MRVALAVTCLALGSALALKETSPGVGGLPTSRRRFQRKGGRTSPGGYTPACRTTAFFWLPPASPSMVFSRCFQQSRQV
jgi:hypothetical protein